MIANRSIATSRVYNNSDEVPTCTAYKQYIITEVDGEEIQPTIAMQIEQGGNSILLEAHQVLRAQDLMTRWKKSQDEQV